MKAKITSVEYKSEFESKYGILYSFIVKYDSKSAFYSSKKKDQTKFVKGQEAEFTEEEKEGKNGKYLVIKPIVAQFGGYNKQVKKEQSRYAGFAMSYAKDLVVGDKISINDLSNYTEAMFKLMVKLDKTLES